MIFDLVIGGHLLDRVSAAGYLGEKEAAKVISQTASALAYLHENNILYRDLKPEHIYLRKMMKHTT
eukprot:UN26816